MWQSERPIQSQRWTSALTHRVKRGFFQHTMQTPFISRSGRTKRMFTRQHLWHTTVSSACQGCRFVLRHAPSTFQRALPVTLGYVKGQFAHVYIDNVIIFSKSSQEHFQHTQEVRKLHKDAGVRVKPKNCHSIHELIYYFIHLITPGKLLVDWKTWGAIAALQYPTSTFKWLYFWVFAVIVDVCSRSLHR